MAVNKEREEFFSHNSGKRGADRDDTMTEDTMTVGNVSSIAPFTKMIAGIVCMQLDDADADADQAEKVEPELKMVKIVQGFDGNKPILKENTKRITLRMLLSHTGMLDHT